jgi:hypothetical protein
LDVGDFEGLMVLGGCRIVELIRALGKDRMVYFDETGSRNEPRGQRFRYSIFYVRYRWFLRSLKNLKTRTSLVQILFCSQLLNSKYKSSQDQISP